MQKLNGKDNIEYVSILRVLSTLAVILIHVFVRIVLNYRTELSNNEFIVCSFFVYVWQWCVPIFIMISGVLLLNPQKTISLSQIFKKYIYRIILVLLIFGVPFAWIELIFNDKRIAFNQIFQSLKNVIIGKSWDHMWYLYMLIGLYLVLPVFKVFVNNASKDIMKYTLLILFVFTSLLTLISNLFSLSIGVYIPINSVYLFYFLLGYYLSNYENRFHRIFYLIIFVFTCIFIMFILIGNEKFFSVDLKSLFNYSSPSVVLMSISLFLFIKNTKNSNRVIDYLSPLCFGVYIIHPFFLNILYKLLHITPAKYPLLMVIFLTTIVTIFLSYLFSFLACKIKIIREKVL